MLYFFHHYELPVILQQAQLQQLLLRTHHGMGGMMGLAGIAALASGAAYHDAPGTGTQATPPTTQSTTQTVQNTVQSTTQTSPSVSTAQTNTTHTGDVISSRITTQDSVPNSTTTGNQTDERAIATPVEVISNTDKSANSEKAIKIEEIKRKTSEEDIKLRSSSSATIDTEKTLPSGANDDIMHKDNARVDSLTLDRRRKESVETNESDPPVSSAASAVKLAPRASPETDDLD